MRWLCSCAPLIMLAACLTAPENGSPPRAPTDAVSILLFGDTGYDYDWLGPDDYEEAYTAREFVIAELDDWIEEKRPVEDFRLPPMHFAEQTGGYVMASGQWPVSRAVVRWCAAPRRCDFGVMLGDNIYPSGATLGADDRDDAARFDELLWQPYRALRDQDPDFVIYPVLGNHDWESSREGAMLQVDYLSRSPLYRMDGLNYRALAAPGIEIFAIDTTVLLAAETIYEDAIADDGSPADSGVIEAEVPWAAPQGDEIAMVEWLARSLASSDAMWKIVIGHHPIWSSSGTKHEEAEALRRLLMPTLCRYADAYLVGHDHTLEVHTDDCRAAGDGYRNIPPLLQVVSGAAGKQRPLHTPFMAWQDNAFPQKSTYFAEGLVWGFAELGLEADLATVQILSIDATDGQAPTSRYTGQFSRRSNLSMSVGQ